VPVAYFTHCREITSGVGTHPAVAPTNRLAMHAAHRVGTEALEFVFWSSVAAGYEIAVGFRRRAFHDRRTPASHG